MHIRLQSGINHSKIAGWWLTQSPQQLYNSEMIDGHRLIKYGILIILYEYKATYHTMVSY